MADIKVFAENLEDSTKEQIEEISSCPAFEGAKIRIMPDAHKGKGCVIGFTANLGDKVIPNLVGVDIGCGMYCVPLAETIARDDLIQFNRDVKRAVPTGFSLHRDPACVLADFGMESRDWLQDKRKVERSMGKQTAEHHQELAQKTCTADIPDELKYLVGDLSAEYLVDMHNCQRFSNQNRKAIVTQIVERTGIRLDGDGFTTMHNYISEGGMIRKGAISAHAGEMVLIPFNMRDGAVIARGKGNEDWNCSAPHGTGRAMSRTKAFQTLDTRSFVNEMRDAGIYCPSACETTLDESPEAYKPADDVLRLMDPTVDVVHRLKPIWNFKATGKRGRR